MTTAIVHDSLREFGGAEKVVEHWLSLYPEAHIYTLCFVPRVFAESELITKAWNEGRIHTTSEQRFAEKKWWNRWYKFLVPIHVWAMKQLRVSGYDKVLISSVYFAKFPQFLHNKSITHYCHSPSRFLHGLQAELDRTTLHPFVRWGEKMMLPGLKKDDVAAAHRLTAAGAQWQCNSHYMQEEILRAYQAEATVVYPPVNIAQYAAIQRTPDTAEPFYLYYGRVGGHKKVDIAIRACLELGRKLVVSGGFSSADEERRCLEIVKQYPGSKGSVTFLGRQPFAQNCALFSTCRAFLFPGKEDFGITPIEIMAAGIPVIAFGEGGSREYMKDGQNGVTFVPQTVDAMKSAIERFETLSIPEAQIRQSIAPFATSYAW
jgi:glycosyltransferase involved in cell wall biosynthesis